jgi:hypothetical protein
LRQLRRRGDGLGVESNQGIVVGAVQQIDLGAALGSLPQALRDQRMVFAQKGTDHQHAIQLRQLADAHAQPGHSKAFAVGGEIALPQARVKMFATQSAQQFLRQI